MSAEPTKKRPWWDRLMCWLGVHDWRNMDGVCATCGYVDPYGPP